MAAADLSAAALPAFNEWPVDRAWRAIDFVSDLHLSAAMPNTFEGFQRYLRRTSADAVVILGDLFEAWVGDDQRHEPFEARVVDALAEAATQRTVAFMVGNRDFLAGTSLLRASGAMGLPDPTVLLAWGSNVLLTHGDALCLADRPYMAFRAEVRGAVWQASFLARPLDERLEAARQMRARSRERHSLDGDPSIDIDTATAVRWMHTLGAAQMVHGHTHRPGSSALAPGFKRHVLSDWDLDGSPPRAEVLRLTRAGFERCAPEGADALAPGPRAA